MLRSLNLTVSVFLTEQEESDRHQLQQLIGEAQSNDEAIASLIFLVFEKFDGQCTSEKTLSRIFDELCLVLPKRDISIPIKFNWPSEVKIALQIKDGRLRCDSTLPTGRNFVYESDLFQEGRTATAAAT